MAIKSQTQRTLLMSFIVSIALCGLMGIFALLQGTIGDLEAKILLSTTAVGAASILGLAAAIPYERKRWPPLGLLGLIAVAIGLIYCLLVIWLFTNRGDDVYWQWLGTICILAVALPHAGLLSLARLKKSYEWLRLMTLASIGCLVVSLLTMIWRFWDTSDDSIFRIIGIFAIVDVVGAIAVPILHRVSAITVREAVRTTDLELSLSCPRCNRTQKLAVGRSKCAGCGLRFNIEIEEEHCSKCGYPIYMLQSNVCPECGAPIATTAPLTPSPSGPGPG